MARLMSASETDDEFVFSYEVRALTEAGAEPRARVMHSRKYPAQLRSIDDVEITNIGDTDKVTTDYRVNLVVKKEENIIDSLKNLGQD